MELWSILGNIIASAVRKSSSVRPTRRISDSLAFPASRKFLERMLSHLSAASEGWAMSNKAAMVRRRFMELKIHEVAANVNFGNAVFIAMQTERRQSFLGRGARFYFDG